MNIEWEVALILLKNNIVVLRPNNPFKWQSGILAPIYCDHRELLSIVEARESVADILADTIKKIRPTITVIAGVAKAGIPWGTLVADKLSLPFLYGGKQKKDHGKGKQIEGRLPVGKQNICVIEDLISTGDSLVVVANALKEMTKAPVIGGSIFTYELSDSRERFKTEELQVFSLTNITTLLKVAVKEKFLNKGDVKIIKEWRDNPQGWGNKFK